MLLISVVVQRGMIETERVREKEREDGDVYHLLRKGCVYECVL